MARKRSDRGTEEGPPLASLMEPDAPFYRIVGVRNVERLRGYDPHWTSSQPAAAAEADLLLHRVSYTVETGANGTYMVIALKPSPTRERPYPASGHLWVGTEEAGTRPLVPALTEGARAVPLVDAALLAEAESAAAGSPPGKATEVALSDLLSRGKETEVYFDTVAANSAAAFVRTARKQAGFTQKQLAERLGVAQSRVAELERDTKQGPTLGMLARVAKACGKSLGLVLK